MTDQEINEAVARKLGVEYIGVDDPRFNDAMWNSLRCPNYCHSIEAAWEFVDKRAYFRLETISLDSDPLDRAFKCSWGDAVAIADTAPMAICLAYLKLDSPSIP